MFTNRNKRNMFYVKNEVDVNVGKEIVKKV